MISDAKWAALCEALGALQVDVAVVTDREGGRDANLPYLSNHPGDATLLFTAAGDRILFPWDVTLAKALARGVEIVDPHWTAGGARRAVMDRIRALGCGEAFTLAFPANTAYHTVRSFQEAFPGARILCEPNGLDRVLDDARAVKSADEIRILEAGFAIADEVVALMPAWIEDRFASRPREIDLGFFLQKEMLDRGTDGARQAMLVANADRSAQVHQHPQASDAPLCKPGLALVDFWMVHEGYHTDLTIPMLFEPLTGEQEAMVAAVLDVYRDTMNALVTGASIGAIAARARDAFERAGLRPVGGLGHGLGLTGHDAPALRPTPRNEDEAKAFEDRALAEGMVLAVEPGVIHEVHGGFRLENDVVMGPERGAIKTHAPVLRVSPGGKVRVLDPPA